MDQPSICHAIPQLQSHLRQLAKLTTEYCLFFGFDHQLRLINQLSLTSNKQTEIQIDPRRLLLELIRPKTKLIVVIHNHPSGKCFPSQADYQTTYKLMATGELLGFQLLDHLIVTSNGYFSFAESGIIDELKTGSFKNSAQIG